MKMNKDLIINEFDKHFNDPKCELEYTKDYELLLSVMLSAQTTDKSVNMVTRELYKKYDTLFMKLQAFVKRGYELIIYSQNHCHRAAADSWDGHGSSDNQAL